MKTFLIKYLLHDHKLDTVIEFYRLRQIVSASLYMSQHCSQSDKKYIYTKSSSIEGVPVWFIGPSLTGAIKPEKGNFYYQHYKDTNSLKIFAAADFIFWNLHLDNAILYTVHSRRLFVYQGFIWLMEFRNPWQLTYQLYHVIMHSVLFELVTLEAMYYNKLLFKF